jgi:hypothetical protein
MAASRDLNRVPPTDAVGGFFMRGGLLPVEIVLRVVIRRRTTTLSAI